MDGWQVTHDGRRLAIALLCAATVTGQFVAGKALRDTLFLTSLPVTALPAMLVGTSVVSLLLVAIHGRFAQRIVPATLVPALFFASGMLFVGEWLLRPAAPTASAIILYLHISAAGPLLASGFWLIASERFDPHTAKRRFGQLAGAGTLGGLVSALAAERSAAWFGAPAMLPVLAGLQCASGLLVRQLASTSAATHLLPARSLEKPSRSGLRVVADAPYLRHLAALVLLGTTGAALVDYLFKAEAVEAFGRGDQLLRFFALYYAGTSIVTFVLQTSSSHVMLERGGLAATASTPSLALLAGSIVGLIVPGFAALLVTRASESIFRSSWYRAAYELFYTPIPASEKRAAKSVIDVAFDRLGDAAGGALVRLALVLLPAVHTPAILGFAIACSAGAMFAASRLNRGYVGSLQHSLANHAALASTPDPTSVSATRILMRTLLRREARVTHHPAVDPQPSRTPVDPIVTDILHLRSRDRARVVSVLGRDEGIDAALVPHAISLLAWDQVAEHATFALQKVAEERIGQFVDALIDPNQDFAIRRRLARVFSVCVSQRAVDGLMIALDDLRFAVRCQAGRSLLAILDRNPLLRIDRGRILEIVVSELTVGRPVWEGRRLLDEHASGSPLDAFVRDRAGESLAHVFTLLSLVLPREPIQLAFRGLQTDDDHLRGTALEYLDSVLPSHVKQRLWPFLDMPRAAQVNARSREEAIVSLLRSNQSITLNLEELRRRTDPSAAMSV
jgi:hypothetical protein